MIFVIIPVFNRWSFTESCLNSLINQTNTNYKIVIIDHGSSDNTSKLIHKRFPEVIVLEGDEKMWWTAATNIGIQYALNNNADFILTLNNDLLVKPDYIESLLNLQKVHKTALIGSVSVDINNPEKIIYAGTKWNKWTAHYKTLKKLSEKPNIYHEILSTDLLPGRGVLIPVDAFMRNGLYDERKFPHYAADEEFSYRCKKNGYSLLVSTKSIVFSETEATGLKNIHKSKSIKYWKDLFFSRRSPVNLLVRWNWAVKCTPIPPLYFIFDFCRILGSQLKTLR